MKLLLFIVGIGCGSVAAFFGYPVFGPTLIPRLGEEDLLPLVVPVAAPSEKPPDSDAPPAQLEKPRTVAPTVAPAKPEPPKTETSEAPRRSTGAAHASAASERSRAVEREIEERLRLGRRYFRTGELNRAAAEFEAVLKISPNNPSALRYLGATYAQMGQGEKAIVEYRAFLKVVKRGKDAEAVRKVLAGAGVRP